jgi:hypothetical protein
MSRCAASANLDAFDPYATCLTRTNSRSRATATPSRLTQEGAFGSMDGTGYPVAGPAVSPMLGGSDE